MADKKELKRKWAVLAIVFLIVSIAAEIFIFNFRFFTVLSEKGGGTVLAKNFTDVQNAEISNDAISLSDGSSFSVACSSEIRNIKINTEGNAYFTVSVKYTDESSVNTEKDGGSHTINSSVIGSTYINFISSGKAKNVTFDITAPTGTPYISSVEFNKPYFNFNPRRMLFLFLILLLTAVLKQRSLWEKRDVIHSRLYFDSMMIVYALGLFLAFSLYVGYGQNQNFSVNVGEDGDVYRLLTEAFANGQFSFLQNPPSELLNLANPYDPSQRTQGYIFDCALFGGKYYCYFGIAPVITLLLPFRLLTGLYMPTSFACLIFMLLLMSSSLLLYYNVTSKWFKNLSYMQFLGGALVMIFGTNIFYLIARPMFYELAVLSALSFLFLGFSLLISATKSENKRTVKIFFCGVFFALTVAARPTYIIYFAASIPLLINIFYKKSEKKFNFKLTLIFLSVPIALAAFIMYYNFARFGSPFDFGQKYQLTVSDIRYNKFSNIALLPAAIFSYLFSPLKFNLSYPYFNIVSSDSITSAGYYYNWPFAGIFNYPIMFILFLSVSIIKRMPKEKRLLKQFVSIILICALFIIYFDTTAAGVLERYILDIMPMLALVSLILIFEALTYFKTKNCERPMTKVFFAVCVISSIISTLSVSVGEYSVQILNNPNFYQRLSMAIEFWK